MENETNPTETPVHNSRLLDILEKLEEEIGKQNSLKYSLIRGVIYGLGTVIGATVLVTLIAWLAQVLTDITITF